MKGIIVYQSKYGTTKKYATWLREKTGFEMIKTKDASVEKLLNYDILIFGGGIYASGITGLTFVKKNYEKLKDKKILLFCDGASPYHKETIEQMFKQNLQELYDLLPCFYCRGAFHMKAMTFIDRNLCKLLIKSVKKKKSEDLLVWGKALLEAGDGPNDWSDPSYLEPLLKAIDDIQE